MDKCLGEMLSHRLPSEDPAVFYKINGKPVASIPNDVSLAIGDGSNKIEAGWCHGRKAVRLTCSELVIQVHVPVPGVDGGHIVKITKRPIHFHG